MSQRAKAQSWVVDTLLAGTGYEVLHPESRHFMAEIGYDPVDFDRVLGRVKAGAMFPKAWAEVGAEVERKAGFYESRGMRTTARDVFNRAALLFGQAQYGLAVGDPRKGVFREAVNRCTEGVIRLGSERIERVEVAFEDGTLYALAHLPEGSGPAPLVLLIPGMDMYKEDWTKVARLYYLPRGIAVLAVDGPGQGETAGNGLRVTLDNYERAMSALIDHMVARPEIDEDRVGLWGVSMGSYWGLRTAAHDPRVRAAATAMGCYGEMETIFERAQPGFKANFMSMSGYTDEARFDSEVAANMSLQSVVDDIHCPVLMQYGEFDELSSAEETMRLFDALNSPRSLMIFEQEFHALGGVGAEVITGAADWLERALNGDAADAADEAYVMRNGEVKTDDASPAWWLGATPFNRSGR